MSQGTRERFARLVDWSEGRLTEEEAQAVVQELAQGDERLRAEASWLQQFQQARQSVRLASPPPSVREHLRERFQEMSASQRAPSFLQKLIAVLSFDSRAGFASAGTRSATTQGLERQLIFTTSAAEVALNLQPRSQDQLLEVAGQLFIDMFPPGPFSVQLLRATDEIALTATDELGEFSLPPIPAGEYELIISGDLFEIHIPTSLNV